MKAHVLSVLAAGCVLAACGGGGPLSVAPEPTQNYTPTAGTHHSYATHATWTRMHRTLLGEFHFGGDVEPRERLDLVYESDSGLEVYLGASRDGVGVDRLKNYETDLLAASWRNGFRPFTRAPMHPCPTSVWMA